jgi:hypothetical protein
MSLLDMEKEKPVQLNPRFINNKSDRPGSGDAQLSPLFSWRGESVSYDPKHPVFTSVFRSLPEARHYFPKMQKKESEGKGEGVRGAPLTLLPCLTSLSSFAF